MATLPGPSRPRWTQFQMMFAVNTWAIIMTTFALVTSGELWITLRIGIADNPIYKAFLNSGERLVTSTGAWNDGGGTGQLFIFYTIKTFGPIVFTIIMTTRQMFSIVLSTVILGIVATTRSWGSVAIIVLRRDDLQPSSGKPPSASRPRRWWRAASSAMTCTTT